MTLLIGVTSVGNMFKNTKNKMKSLFRIFSMHDIYIILSFIQEQIKKKNKDESCKFPDI